jgi:hypothetical protein
MTLTCVVLSSFHEQLYGVVNVIFICNMQRCNTAFVMHIYLYVVFLRTYLPHWLECSYVAEAVECMPLTTTGALRDYFRI